MLGSRYAKLPVANDFILLSSNLSPMPTLSVPERRLALLSDMPDRQTSAVRKTIALVRILTSFFFLFFGQYKVFGWEFAHGGFAKYLGGYIGGEAVSCYRPLLERVVLPHATFFGYAVDVAELFVGISLLLGIFVRPASVVGALHMLSLTLATFWSPGHNVPTWRYFGYQLDHIPMLFLFVIFFAARAGETWGLDGRLGRSSRERLRL
jgi:uncharacterized membrane protein YphA (DoxX/SURF4 family)